MKRLQRRHALITSATVSVVVLGGAVAAAAWSGAGVLGFGSGPADNASSDASASGEVQAVSTTAVESAVSAPGTTVEVRVIEDRIVVKSGAGAGSGASDRVGVSDSLRIAGIDGALDVGADRTEGNGTSATPSTTTPRSSTTVRARPHDEDDDDDEYEHDDDDREHEYEHEHEHEYEDD